MRKKRTKAAPKAKPGDLLAHNTVFGKPVLPPAPVEPPAAPSPPAPAPTNQPTVPPYWTT